jgi:hypothetical protein
MRVKRRQTAAGVDQQQRHVGIVDGLVGLRPHAGFHAVVEGLFEACRVDRRELQIAQRSGAFAAVARHPGGCRRQGPAVCRSSG